MAFFGALAVISARGANFPLKTDVSNRFLVDQTGVPFLIQGDSPWSMIAALNNDQVNAYLQDRSQKGFNTLIVELIEHESIYPRGDNDNVSPANYYGESPFLTPGDFSTPNEAYFTNADWVIDQAAAKGMVVVLFPCYVGFVGTSEGWEDEVLSNGAAKCQQYGQYVGNRYKNRPNIIWAMYGDRDPDEAQPMVDAMAAGIQSADTNHIFTAHLQRGSDVRSLLPNSAWLQLDTSYTDMQTYVGCLQAYAETPAMPVFQIENYYEGEHGTAPANVRAEAYWANLSGACGQVFGNLPIWPFTTGWESALDSVGANDMRRVQALFLSRPWTSLVPDAVHTVVTAGYGSDVSYVAAARTSDGGTVMAYLPMGGTITVDLTQISGAQAQGWWYNPRDGSITNLGGFATSGSQDFTAPDDNDWVLVLDDASRNLPPPGLISPHLGIAVVGQNTFEISFSSNPGLSFSVQSNSGSSNAPWQTIGTVTTDDSGGAVYDVTTTSAAGLYRVTYP